MYIYPWGYTPFRNIRALVRKISEVGVTFLLKPLIKANVTVHEMLMKKTTSIVAHFVYHSSNINMLILSLSLVNGKKIEKEKIMCAR